MIAWDKQHAAFRKEKEDIGAFAGFVEDMLVGIEILEKENGNRQVILSFEDDGIAYNLLEKPEPDFNEIREKGKLGGLGIYLVKNQMDCMEYEYSDGKNKLKLIKTERKEPHRR